MAGEGAKREDPSGAGVSGDDVVAGAAAAGDAASKAVILLSGAHPSGLRGGNLSVPCKRVMTPAGGAASFTSPAACYPYTPHLSLS